MANGEEVQLAKQTRISANGVRVIDEADGANGFVYMLEDVLLPTWVGRHIADQLFADQATFPTFVELLALDSTLAATLGSESQAYTVFAPSEAAFASLGGSADGMSPSWPCLPAILTTF